MRKEFQAGERFTSLATDKDTEVIEVLKMARERVRQGWIRGLYHDTTGFFFKTHRYCAVGAIYEGIPVVSRWDIRGTGGDARWRAVRALHAALPFDSPFFAVETFNDNATYGDVLALYDRAIAAQGG